MVFLSYLPISSPMYTLPTWQIVNYQCHLYMHVHPWTLGLGLASNSTWHSELGLFKEVIEQAWSICLINSLKLLSLPRILQGDITCSFESTDVGCSLLVDGFMAGDEADWTVHAGGTTSSSTGMGFSPHVFHSHVFVVMEKLLGHLLLTSYGWGATSGQGAFIGKPSLQAMFQASYIG